MPAIMATSVSSASGDIIAVQPAPPMLPLASSRPKLVTTNSRRSITQLFAPMHIPVALLMVLLVHTEIFMPTSE